VPVFSAGVLVRNLFKVALLPIGDGVPDGPRRPDEDLLGLDLVRTKLVSEIEVKDAKVRVVIDLKPNHQFASAIREEVIEKIEPLWDVEEVEVIFTD
jgi:hypothetical protein